MSVLFVTPRPDGTHVVMFEGFHRVVLTDEQARRLTSDPKAAAEFLRAQEAYAR